MRPLIGPLAALLLTTAHTEAQTARSRAPGAVPPIIVEEGAGPARRAQAPRQTRRPERRSVRRTIPRERTRVVPESVTSPLLPRSGEAASINRSLAVQGQIRNQEQQNQFELNQLRQQIQRNQFSPVGGFGGSPGCPAGSIGC